MSKIYVRTLWYEQDYIKPGKKGRKQEKTGYIYMCVTARKRIALFRTSPVRGRWCASRFCLSSTTVGATCERASQESSRAPAEEWARGGGVVRAHAAVFWAAVDGDARDRDTIRAVMQRRVGPLPTTLTATFKL
jgi:hypothetical protein